MEITLRQEMQSDHSAVFDVIQQAFKDEVYSDHKEQFLVERLRGSDAFIPELSIVAVFENQIIGHILMSSIKIIHETSTFDSLALAPVSVLPTFQKKGIGSRLINYAHQQAKRLGHRSVILLGHKDYYPRFGYQTLDQFDIRLPFEAPTENCMGLELIEHAFQGVIGTVEYPQAFYE